MKNFQNYHQKNQIIPRSCRAYGNKAYVHKPPARSRSVIASKAICKLLIPTTMISPARCPFVTANAVDEMDSDDMIVDTDWHLSPPFSLSLSQLPQVGFGYTRAVYEHISLSPIPEELEPVQKERYIPLLPIFHPQTSLSAISEIDYTPLTPDFPINEHALDFSECLSLPPTPFKENRIHMLPYTPPPRTSCPSLIVLPTPPSKYDDGWIPFYSDDSTVFFKEDTKKTFLEKLKKFLPRIHKKTSMDLYTPSIFSDTTLIAIPTKNTWKSKIRSSRHRLFDKVKRLVGKSRPN